MARKPLIEGESSRQLGVRLPESLWDEFDAVCNRRGIAKSDVVRGFVQEAVLEAREEAA